MVRRGRKVWRTAALAVALLWVASPSWAAARLWQGADWAGLWERAVAWLGGQGSLAAPAPSSGAAGRQGREKYSSSIDPDGQTVPASSAQPDYSPGIDPNGRH